MMIASYCARVNGAQSDDRTQECPIRFELGISLHPIFIPQSSLFNHFTTIIFFTSTNLRFGWLTETASIR